MNLKIFFISFWSAIAILSGLVSYFFNAPFWLVFPIASGAIFLNGLLATWEDRLPGGFENPNGKKSIPGWASLALILTTGLVTIFSSQASSPNYNSLFLGVVIPSAVLTFVLTASFFYKVKIWRRWLAIGISVVTFVAVAEMAIRVFGD